jgi:2-phosphosulfolactate phosphatase
VAAEHGSIVIAACLRNAAAVAEWLNGQEGTVAVIPCGERWPDGSLRPAVEDYLGAAWLVSVVKGRRSAEAELAASSFGAVESRVAELVRDCASGRELVERGRSDDLDYAVDLGVSETVPILVDGAFTSASTFRGDGSRP